MRLTDFIRKNHESIIKNWVEFASTIMPWAKGMTERALRDHAEEHPPVMGQGAGGRTGRDDPFQ